MFTFCPILQDGLLIYQGDVKREIRGVVSKFFEQKKNKHKFFGWTVKNDMSAHFVTL